MYTLLSQFTSVYVSSKSTARCEHTHAMAFTGWQQKKVLVTGAGSGIGRAAVLAFLKSGASVSVRFLQMACESNKVHGMRFFSH